MALLRTFIALETPKAERERFSRIQFQLKEAGADIRWEHEDKFHVTIKFLGDTNEEVVPKIETIIKTVCTSFSPFTVVFDSVGFFPNWQKPRVVWIGGNTHNPVVSRLKTQLDKDLAPLGFQIENRAFHPHITMGRIRSDKGIKHLLSIAENLTFEPSKIVMDELILMKSILRPEGSKYVILGKFKL